MSEPAKRKEKKESLPCQWVDQEGFEILTGHSAKKPRKPSSPMSDTALLLRAKKTSSPTPPGPG
jgi:hypothetical protein